MEEEEDEGRLLVTQRWRLVLEREGGQLIVSPPIVPDNPRRSWDYPKILMSIARIGREIVEEDKEIRRWYAITDPEVYRL